MRVDYDKDQLAYALANAIKERDEARAVVRMLWEIAEVGLDDLSDEQLERVDRSWGAAEK